MAFRNVHLFLDAARDFARIHSAREARHNLNMCFKGDAAEWFISELTDEERRKLRGGHGIERWEKALLDQFKTNSTEAWRLLGREHFNEASLQEERTPQNYVLAVVRYARDAGIRDVHGQLM